MMHDDGTTVVVENVRGAQKWVGRAKWHFGGFYLWGDVPALMPEVTRAPKMPGRGMSLGDVPWGAHHTGPNERATKNTGGSWFAVGSPGQKITGRNPVSELAAIKGGGGSWFGEGNDSPMRQGSSKSNARKMASAMIAKIPLALAQHIAHAWKPVLS